jgi:hypothetical protein
MPIRINLLAEAQAAAEMRRKDPVKRGIWIGSFLVLVVVLWIAKLQLDISFEQHEFNKIEADWKGKMTKYAAVTNAQARTSEIERKLAELDALHTNRFLWAPVLDALQKTMVDQVQVIHLTGIQAESKEDGKEVTVGGVKRRMPGAMIEKIGLNIEAEDLKPSDENYNKYKETLCTFDFFATRLKRRDGFVLDGVLGPLTADPVDPNKQFRTFTLASHFPEVRVSE